MPLDLISIGVGAAAGGIATAIALNLGVRKVRSAPLRVSPLWGVDDVRSPGAAPPRIMTEYIGEGVAIPDGARILVPKTSLATVPPDVLARAEVRTHAEVHTNVVIGDDRVLVVSGALRPKTWAASTLDEAAVARLKAEFQRLWESAEPYFERVTVAEAGEFAGRMVEITGTAGDLVDYQSRKMLKVTDREGRSVSVVTKDAGAAGFQGATVRVTGRVKGDGAHPFIEARSIERVATEERRAAVPVR
ncbi:MAG TPA: hypothetical protein VM889_05495 [Candidatus Thermoplasmatota archaeon]|nr:hypothetical protein [Candidatus Thermoplasmatota archaeon]